MGKYYQLYSVYMVMRLSLIIEPVCAQGSAFSMIMENDIFTGSDNNYTNGLGFSWSSDELTRYKDQSFVRNWSELWSFLPFVNLDSGSNYISWTLSQEMNTPDNISELDPPSDDQPYSGVLFVDSLLQSRQGRWHHIWGLRLGIVGPSSGAESAQNNVHKKIGSDEPLGWSAQLPDEPIVNVSYTISRLWRENNIGSSDWRIVHIAGFNAGNFAAIVSGGVYGEIGWNLSGALGQCALRNGFDTSLTIGGGPKINSSFSFYFGLGGNGVAHYLPLDGNIFRSSHSVNSEPFVGFANGGIVYRYKRFSMSLSLSYFTKTFTTQRESPEFGSLGLAWYR